jgi:hypothetical protein
MKTFKQFFEDMASAMSTGPTNVVGAGDIAGTGGLGGEPGVSMGNKRKKNPILTPTLSRKN